jgi:shikimate dehydrogenase
MHPAVDVAPPLPYDFLGPQHLLYDLVYNPPMTRFLALGLAMGAVVKNGLEMLGRQAEASWRIWNGKS